VALTALSLLVSVVGEIFKHPGRKAEVLVENGQVKVEPASSDQESFPPAVAT
jgi:hypothetical protein